MRGMQAFRICLALLLVLISSSFLNMALSKSSSHFPLLTSDVLLNGGTGSSNISGAYNQSFLTSRPYFAHAPSDYTLYDNISGAVSDSNNKVVMIGFDDGWKSQITYGVSFQPRIEYSVSCRYSL